MKKEIFPISLPRELAQGMKRIHKRAEDLAYKEIKKGIKRGKYNLKSKQFKDI